MGRMKCISFQSSDSLSALNMDVLMRIIDKCREKKGRHEGLYANSRKDKAEFECVGLTLVL